MYLSPTTICLELIDVVASGSRTSTFVGSFDSTGKDSTPKPIANNELSLKCIKNTKNT